MIFSTLDKSMMHHTSAANTLAEVWKRLQDLYQATDSTHKMSITKQFHTLTMGEGDHVEKFVQQFRSLRARLALCGTTLTETKAVEAFLASLLQSYAVFQLHNQDSWVRVKLLWHLAWAGRSRCQMS